MASLLKSTVRRRHDILIDKRSARTRTVFIVFLHVISILLHAIRTFLTSSSTTPRLTTQ
jgi:hypothetical protein